MANCDITVATKNLDGVLIFPLSPLRRVLLGLSFSLCSYCIVYLMITSLLIFIYLFSMFLFRYLLPWYCVPWNWVIITVSSRLYYHKNLSKGEVFINQGHGHWPVSQPRSNLKNLRVPEGSQGEPGGAWGKPEGSQRMPWPGGNLRRSFGCRCRCQRPCRSHA